MFKSSVSLVALSLLSGDTQATNIKYRPLPGTAPWDKAPATVPTFTQADYPASVGDYKYPVNYFVPNLGMDRDVKWTHSNLKNAEKKLGKKLYANYEGPKDSPWPSLKYQGLVQVSDVNNEQKAPVLPAGNNQSVYFSQVSDVNNEQKAPVLPAGHNQSVYFSQVSDVNNEQKAPVLPAGHNQSVYFSQVSDVNNEQKAPVLPAGHNQSVYFAQQSQPQGPFKIADVMLENGSDPICNSAGCTQYLFPKLKKEEAHPMNYPVPNLGMDRDILHSLENIPVAEGLVGHKWVNFGTEESKARYHNKAKDAMYDFDPKLSHEIVVSQNNLSESEEKLKKKFELLQVDEQSDPICNSAGCTQYLFPKLSKEEDHPINYPVPNLGMDRDILHSLENIPVAEGLVGHKWTDFGTEESKARYHNKAKDALYDFDPKLSHDIIVSQDNLADSEKKLDHKYTLA